MEHETMTDKVDFETAVRPTMAADYAGINGDYHFTSEEGEEDVIPLGWV